MHRASKLALDYLIWFRRGLGWCLMEIEKARRVFTESFEAASTTKEICLVVVCERAGSRGGTDGHATDGIDLLLTFTGVDGVLVSTRSILALGCHRPIVAP